MEAQVQSTKEPSEAEKILFTFKTFLKVPSPSPPVPVPEPLLTPDIYSLRFRSFSRAGAAVLLGQSQALGGDGEEEAEGSRRRHREVGSGVAAPHSAAADIPPKESCMFRLSHGVRSLRLTTRSAHHGASDTGRAGARQPPRDRRPIPALRGRQAPAGPPEERACPGEGEQP